MESEILQSWFWAAATPSLISGAFSWFQGSQSGDAQDELKEEEKRRKQEQKDRKLLEFQRKQSLISTAISGQKQRQAAFIANPKGGYLRGSRSTIGSNSAIGG